ncbi:MAG: hypothetical protein JNL82_28525 [Myxococcales bacterium]|nr:hypothetical protein [Myxococcales bacterium]
MPAPAWIRRLRVPTPFELFLGLCFAFAAHVVLEWARAPVTACVGGWSASESVEGVEQPRGVPCTRNPAQR